MPYDGDSSHINVFLVSPVKTLKFLSQENTHEKPRRSSAALKPGFQVMSYITIYSSGKHHEK